MRLALFNRPESPPLDALRFALDLSAERRLLISHGLAAGGLWLVLGLAVLSGRLAPDLYAAPLTLYSSLVGFWTLNAMSARRRAAVLALSGTDLFVPSLRHWSGVRKLPIAALQRIDYGANELRLGVAGKWPVVLPLQAFGAEEETRRFVDALALRSRLRVLTQTMSRAPTRLTWLLVAALVASHFARALANIDLAFGLIEWGGLNRVLVLEGEWFRLVTSAFVQTDVVHLSIDVVLLWLFLPDLQRLMGSASVVGLLFVATVCGAFAALGAYPGICTVGASALVYGLLGAATWLWFTERSRAPRALFEVPAWALGSLITVDLALLLMNPFMSFAGHVMGFSVGAGVTGLLQRYGRRLRPMLFWVGPVVIGIVVVAFAQLLVNSTAVGVAVTTAHKLIASKHGSIQDANYGAWAVAIKRDVGPRELVAVRDAFATRITQAGDAEGPVRDTLATLHYRTGNVQEAVAIESQVMDQEPDAVTATQLARFERAAGNGLQQFALHVERDGERTCVIGGPAQPLDVDLLITQPISGVQVAPLIGLVRIVRLRGQHCFTVASTVALDIGRSAQSVGAVVATAKTDQHYWPTVAALAGLP